MGFPMGGKVGKKSGREKRRADVQDLTARTGVGEVKAVSDSLEYVLAFFDYRLFEIFVRYPAGTTRLLIVLHRRALLGERRSRRETRRRGQETP